MIKKIRKVFLSYMPILFKVGFMYRWPSLYSLLEIGPSSAMIMITDRCNSRCVMCKQWREEYGEELSTEEWKNIIYDLKRNGIRNIHFTGGEPLLRSDLNELISYSSSYGFAVGITTNGILLNKQMLGDFVNKGLRSIAISVDGIDAAYDAIRGVQNVFGKVRDSVFAIAEANKRNNIDAYVNFTLMKSNIQELKNVKRLSDEARLPLHISLLDKSSSIFNLEENKGKLWIEMDQDPNCLEDIISFLKSEATKRPGSLIINFPAIDFIKEYFKNPLQEDIPCAISQDRIIIDPYGNVLGGCFSMGEFGNIKDKGFGELKQDKKYKTAKRNMFYKECPGCSCGYVFNIRHFAPCIVKNIVSSLKYSLGAKDG